MWNKVLHSLLISSDQLKRAHMCQTWVTLLFWVYGLHGVLAGHQALFSRCLVFSQCSFFKVCTLTHVYLYSTVLILLIYIYTHFIRSLLFCKFKIIIKIHNCFKWISIIYSTIILHLNLNSYVTVCYNISIANERYWYYIELRSPHVEGCNKSKH